jgi:ring-1,2-phenylacetyl-CoA epoxidase subunit PaaB
VTVWEVFRQERKGQPFQHAGSLQAPDERFAHAYARAFYARRQESSALWIVPRSDLREVDPPEPGFDPDYRRVDGYSLKTRLREARDRAAARPR